MSTPPAAAPSDSAWLARARRSALVREPVVGSLRDLALLPPHASLRRYARASFDARTEIVMLMPPAGAAPDEAGGTARTDIHDDPFVVTTRWLRGAGIPVPELYAVDEREDALWLEDVGDLDFDAWIACDRSLLEARYHDALDLLSRFQSAVAPGTAPPLVRGRSFGRELLRWELDHYVEWRVEAHLGRTPTAAQRAALGAAFDRLVDTLVEVPTHVMHRDFQSHNIMVRDGQLVLLDHQDAMVGPVVYDAVALLRDSYVRIPTEVLARLVRRYAATVVAAGLAPGATEDDVATWFHMQTLQRKLKDAGRFVFIDRVKHNPSFLSYIPDSVAYVRDALTTLGRRVEDVAAVLADLDPEAVP